MPSAPLDTIFDMTGNAWEWCSDFFEEITDLFVNTNFIRSASDENVIHKLTEALESWGLDEYSNLMQKKEKLSNESILNYRETIGLIK